MWKTIDSTQSVVIIVNVSVPYYISGVAAAIGFKMNLFNIGTNGQYLLAALDRRLGRRRGEPAAGAPRSVRDHRRHHRREAAALIAGS